MNGLNAYTIVAGVSIAILTTVFNAIYHYRYKINTELFAQGNQELREQNRTLREEKAELTNSNTQLQTQLTAKDTLIKELKDINSRQPEVLKVMSNNHAQVMDKLTDLTTVIAGGHNAN